MDKVTPTSLVLHTHTGMSVHNIFIFFYHALWLLLFVFFLTLDNEKNKWIRKNKKKKTLNLWIDLVNLNVLFLRNSRKLDFLCDCINGVCSPDVLKNMFVILFSETHSIDFSYGAIKVNVMEICEAKFLSLICRKTPINL